MNKFKLYFAAFCTLSVLFSCHKADDDTIYEVPRNYYVQYPTDLALIGDFLATHYIDPNQDPDSEIVISDTATSTATQLIIDSPLLNTVDVLLGGVTHRIYYLKLREGVGNAPSRVDQVLAAYSGSYLSRNGENVTNTNFQSLLFPEVFFSLDQTISAWTEIMPLFKTGVLQPGDGSGPAVYSDYGVGVMFLPSALGYYNIAQSSSSGSASIPAYSPLIFTFKLYDMKRSDQDGDGIASDDEIKIELTDGVYTYTYLDTDGDGKANYLDIDDDGDGYLTINEIKKPDGWNIPGNPNYSGDSNRFPFNPTPDNPLTLDLNESETAGVPDCSGNTTSPDRLRKYLDPSCH